MSRFVDQHARHHALIDLDRPPSPEEAVLALMFRKAYEHASALADGPILDVGCNTGYGTAILRERTGAEAVGVDVSPRAIEVARDRWGGEFQVVNGSTLPFEDGAFGAVTSCQVLEHIEEPVPFLAEIHRVLRPGGRAFLTTPNAATRLDPGQEPWNRFHAREYRPDELRALLQPHFAAVTIEGLFGSPELEAIERDRVARVRKAGRLRNRVAWMLPLPVEDALVRTVRAVGRLRPAPELEREVDALDTSHLRYEPVDLDRSLDLMAICER